MITAFTSPVSGIWPLGKILVTTAGTPVALNVNVGPQTGTLNTRPSGNVRQLIFFPEPNNTDNMYVIRKVQGQTVNYQTANFIVAVITNQPVSLPYGSTVTGAFLNVDDYLIDADESGNQLIAVAYYG